MKTILETVLAILFCYFLAVVFAPALGFTALLDIAYLIDGQPFWALMWMLVFGPAILATLVYFAPDQK